MIVKEKNNVKNQATLSLLPQGSLFKLDGVFYMLGERLGVNDHRCIYMGSGELCNILGKTQVIPYDYSLEAWEKEYD